jgi:hypothetical protein
MPLVAGKTTTYGGSAKDPKAIEPLKGLAHGRIYDDRFS